MKRLFFFIVVALMLASCASTRKIQETTASVSVDSTSVKETARHESEKVVDTTRTEHGKVVITEIIFDTAPDPKRWRYYFYLAAVGVVVLLYLKRVPIINWIKRILSGLRRIF